MDANIPMPTPTEERRGVVRSQPRTPVMRLKVADTAQFSLFIAYNATYVAYTNGYAPRSAYIVLFFTFVALCAARIALRLLARGEHLTNLHFGKSSQLLFIAIAYMLGYSMVRQFAIDQTINMIAIHEVLYVAAPVVIALAIANSTSDKLADVYMYAFFCRYVLDFLLSSSGHLSLSTIHAINWFASYSAFESSFAHDLLVLECYFLFRNKRVLGAVAGGLTMLSLKRASFIAAPIIYLFRSRLRKSRRPSRAALWSLFAFGIASPFLMMAFYSEGVTSYLRDRVGLDVNRFASGRQSIYWLVRDNIPNPVGFGSINAQLSELTSSNFGTTWDGLFHNDTLRVFLEVGPLGLALYVGAIVYASRSHQLSFILGGYALFVLTTSRLITHPSFWVVLFVTMALIERHTTTALPPRAIHQRSARGHIP